MRKRCMVRHRKKQGALLMLRCDKCLAEKFERRGCPSNMISIGNHENYDGTKISNFAFARMNEGIHLFKRILKIFSEYALF